MNLDKMSAGWIGFLQTLGVAIYCSLVALFFRLMGNNQVENAPEIWGIALMLFLLVFSAAVCGLLVFGYPIYLIIQHNIKRALQILAFNFLYAVIMFIIILSVIIL
ncbi:MAG: hypothetical protein WCS88_03765 [Patescibacteria group bacterium]